MILRSKKLLRNTKFKDVLDDLANLAGSNLKYIFDGLDLGSHPIHIFPFKNFWNTYTGL